MPSYSREELARTFLDPPAEFGPVDGYWWEAGRLDKDKLRWQLEELRDKGVSGTWFYARFLSGEPLGSDPAYLSDEWWEFTRFAAEEHRRLGLINWFSSWTLLEFEQEAIRQQRDSEPSLWGHRLVVHEATSVDDGPLELEIPDDDEILDVAAYRRDGDSLDYQSREELHHAVGAGKVEWTPPGRDWVLTVIAARPWDLDYLNPEIGKRWNDVILGEYERRLPGFMGDGVGAFGPDEMTLLNGATVYSPVLLEWVQSERGYDPAPYLIGLFRDIGPKTEQIRSNYRQAMTVLLDENFYQATTRWLHERGMQHVSLSQLNDDALTHTYHYGDFFRYLRSFDAPGNEDPFPSAPGGRRLFRTKMSSSVAHLYERERVVLCAHYATGWGHNLEENLTWTLEAYAKGSNLYNRHLISYGLLGGWYEYVPPADHFYQPFWRYWKVFADYVRRLSFIMSQGQHRPDVALLYPLTTLHADWVDTRDSVPGDGRGSGDQEGALLADRGLEEVFGPAAREASQVTEELAKAIYHDGIDFDFVDDESFERAEVSGDVLAVSGVEFRSVVMPPMTTVRRTTMEKIKAFHDSGGTVVAFGRLPTASAEAGRGDPQLQSMIDQIFHADSGRGVFISADSSRVPETLSRAVDLDVIASEKGVFQTHQKAGDLDIYLLFNVHTEERDLTFDLRAVGRPEVWDPFTGETRAVHRVVNKGDRTEVRLAMKPNEGIVLVFTPDGADRPAVLDSDVGEVTHVESTGGGVLVEGFDPAGGRKQARVRHEGREYLAEAEVDAPPAAIVLEEPFSFRLEPTMHNRWGDFRYPPADELIGPEARRFRYQEEASAPGLEQGWHDPEFDDSGWPEVTYSYGPYWQHLGPFQPDSEPDGLLEKAKHGDPELDWEPYSFSKKFGAERPEQQEGFLGWFRHLLGVSDNFLVLDDAGVGTTEHDNRHYLFTTVEVPAEGAYTLRVGRSPEHPELTGISLEEFIPYTVPPGTQAWINGVEVFPTVGQEVAEIAAEVRLHEGPNSVLLRVVYPAGGRLSSYAVFLDSEPAERDPHVPLLHWFRTPQELVYDVKPADATRVGWYRFKAPPGLREIRLRAEAVGIEAWVDGTQFPVHEGVITLDSARPRVSTVALRVRQRPGTYGGAVFTEPVAFECDTGAIELGDWTRFGLATYSGIGVYSTDVTLQSTHVGGRVLLDLGRVKTVADVVVNGRPAGVKIAGPFVFDVTGLVRAGHNAIDIKVANTLANHMSTYPTKWVFDGQTESGLLGPVQLRFLAPVRLTT